MTASETMLLRSRRRFDAENLAALRKQSETDCRLDWADYRRGGIPVRLAMTAAAAARLDAADRWGGRTGILGWNGAGARTENIRYWQDYTGHDGSGRGALFVGTLNSIPVCEAAILLHTHGASGYWHGTDWRAAGEVFIAGNGLRHLLMIQIDRTAAAALLMDADGELPDELAEGDVDFRTVVDRIAETEGLIR